MKMINKETKCKKVKALVQNINDLKLCLQINGSIVYVFLSYDKDILMFCWNIFNLIEWKPLFFLMWIFLTHKKFVFVA